jgi:serine/threonine-protein kinase
MRRFWTTSHFRSGDAAHDFIDEIAGYRVIRELGVGAGSTVYEVQDPADNHLYALKVVRKQKESDKRFLAQAVNEYEISKHLEHGTLRHCVKQIRGKSFGRVNEVLLLLELVEGTNLEERRPKSVRRLMEIFHAAAEGLNAMHAKGLVHADIKPQNIMLTAAGEVKLIDFGQSCPINTIKDRIQGTAGFIAPEQVRLQPISRRTDVFNLGATMYWCVTDLFPPTLLEEGKDTAWEKRTDDPLLNPAIVNASVPPALSALIVDCLEEDRARRPKSMTTVQERLEFAMHQFDAARQEAISDARTMDVDEALALELV